MKAWFGQRLAKGLQGIRINADFYLYRNIGFNDMLRDFIDNSITKERLWAEYQEALAT